MPKLQKLASLVVLALAALFGVFFMFAKHDPSLSAIIPFANDPYDAVGSFAAIISALLGGLALLRAVRPFRRSLPTEADRVFLARTQMAIVVAVLMPAAADAIAMTRHPSMWLGQTGGNELLLLVTGMTALAAAVGFLVRHSARDLMSPSTPGDWRRAAATGLVFVVILALYPEGIINSVPGELLTLAVGILLLFAPMSAFVVALAPYDAKIAHGEATTAWWARRWIRWGAVVLLGMAIGTSLLVAEASQGDGGIAPARLALVASVYIGAGTVGLVVAYAFLNKPLGLSRR